MNDSQTLKKKLKRFIKKSKPAQPEVELTAQQKELLQLKERLLALLKKPSKPKWYKRYETDLQLILIPMILLIVFLIFSFINQILGNTINQNAVLSSDLSADMNPYPFVNNVQMPQLSAKAAIILDVDSQVIPFSKNPDLRFSMASTTKIMTALVGLEYFKSDDILTVRTTTVEGGGLGMYYGEQFRFEDLLYAMMLPSANDAAQAISDNYPGGEEAFVKKMNEKAQNLNLYNTHFADPIGLDDDGDYTTVVDMARLASYAITNPKFAQVTSTKERLIHDRSYTRSYPLTNLNKLLGYNGVTGIKTGTTEGAGEVLVTSTIANGHTYIIVVMNSTDRFADTETLLSFIAEDVQYILPTFPAK